MAMQFLAALVVSAVVVMAVPRRPRAARASSSPHRQENR